MNPLEFIHSTNYLLYNMKNINLSQKIEQLVNVILALERKPRDFGRAVALTTTQIHAIQVIGERQSVTMNEVAERMNLSKSTITQVVEVLIRKGCVKRKKEPTDKRKTLLHLTETGHEAFLIHEDWHQELLSLFSSRFEDAEIRTLGTFLDNVIELFQQKISSKEFRRG